MDFLSKVFSQIDNRTPIYIVVHERPDGDAMGSQIALTLYLNSLGKKAFAVQAEEISDTFKGYFRGTPCIKLSELNNDSNPLWVALDCVNKTRIAQELQDKTFAAVIDHHPAEAHWAQHTFVNSSASSTCEILTKLFEKNGYKFQDNRINTALYLGLLTDSGNFSHSNITPHTFECAERLVSAGVQPYKIIQQLFNNKTPAQLKLQSVFLNNVTLYRHGTIAVSTLCETDYKNTHTCHSDTEGFVNLLLALKNIKIAVFIEDNNDFIKGSLRSSEPTIAVNLIAKKWEGGGHTCAAGFKVGKDKFDLKELIHDLDSLLT